MEPIKTRNSDEALGIYLSVINNILSEYGQPTLSCDDEIALASNLFRSGKSYIDCVLTVLALRQDRGYLH